MKSGNWTVIFDDKKIIKKIGAEAGIAYDIEDNSFWNDSKWGNVWAIQFTDDNTDNDQVEHRDATPHSFYDNKYLDVFKQVLDLYLSNQEELDNWNKGGGREQTILNYILVKNNVKKKCRYK